MARVYKIEFEETWTYGSGGLDEVRVLATSAESAIAKLKAQRKVGEQSQAHDDNEKPIKGKFYRRTKLRIDSVTSDGAELDIL